MNNFRLIARKLLFILIVLIVTAASVYCFTYRDRLFPFKNTVIVYGREACGITQMVRTGLAKRGIPYTFADIDIQAVDDEMWYKLGPNFTERRITFPIVHVAGKMLITPAAEKVQTELTKYIEATSPDEVTRDYSTFLNGASPAPH